MDIKYGELTIIYNPENTNIITKFINWVASGNEKPPDNAKYIFLFDNEEICEYNDEILDYKYKFFNSIITQVPLYFEKPEKEKYHSNIYFLKNSYDYLIDFNEIFESYSKFNSLMNMKSKYNCIFHHHKMIQKQEIFSIIRIKSNIDMPRYQFAYDSNEFTKKEIIYLIRTIFS
jgi:hypothetical protein